MKVQTTGDQKGSEQLSEPKHRSPLISLLLLIIAFILGGCLSLLMVNQMLTNQSDLYVALDQMSDASVVLDIMEDMIPLYFLCGSIMLLVLGIFAAVWAWTKTQSTLLRYGSILLLLIILILLAGVWFAGRVSVPAL